MVFNEGGSGGGMAPENCVVCVEWNLKRDVMVNWTRWNVVVD